MDIYLSNKEAAEYANVSVQYLQRQCVQRTGPAFIRPSPKRTLFRKADLDAWVASWPKFETIKRK